MSVLSVMARLFGKADAAEGQKDAEVFPREAKARAAFVASGHDAIKAERANVDSQISAMALAARQRQEAAHPELDTAEATFALALDAEMADLLFGARGRALVDSWLADPSLQNTEALASDLIRPCAALAQEWLGRELRPHVVSLMLARPLFERTPEFRGALTRHPYSGECIALGTVALRKAVAGEDTFSLCETLKALQAAVLRYASPCRYEGSTEEQQEHAELWAAQLGSATTAAVSTRLAALATKHAARRQAEFEASFAQPQSRSEIVDRAVRKGQKPVFSRGLR